MAEFYVGQVGMGRVGFGLSCPAPKVQMSFPNFAVPPDSLQLTYIKYRSRCRLRLNFRRLSQISYTHMCVRLYPLSNFSTKYLVMCKVYTDVGGIK